MDLIPIDRWSSYGSFYSIPNINNYLSLVFNYSSNENIKLDGEKSCLLVQFKITRTDYAYLYGKFHPDRILSKELTGQNLVVISTGPRSIWATVSAMAASACITLPRFAMIHWYCVILQNVETFLATWWWKPWFKLSMRFDYFPALQWIFNL